MTDLIDKGHFAVLAKLDPKDVCKRASCAYDEITRCYTLPVWGTSYTIHPDSCKIECADTANPLHEYMELFAIHYLLTSKETAPSSEWISEKDMAGGVTFFRGPHEIPTRLISARVNNSVDAFRQLCTQYGGLPLDMADASFAFQITDRIPVAVLYWEGDDEFPAEAKILYDRTLPEHFALDIVYALAIGICEELGK